MFESGDRVRIAYTGFLWPHIDGLEGTVDEVVIPKGHPEELWYNVYVDGVPGRFPLDPECLKAA